jgi:hypothetical protein
MFGQVKPINSNHIKQTKTTDVVNDDEKSSWIGGECNTSRWWTGANAAGGSEIFIKGSDFGIPTGHQITKVRFYHHYGTVIFSGGSQVNFNNTSYTIEIYQNPTLTNYYYSNIYYPSIGTPIYTQTVTLPTTSSNTTCEITLNTAYTITNAPFLIGIKFNNGKAAVKLSETMDMSHVGKYFFLYNDDEDPEDDDINLVGNVISETGNSTAGAYSVGLQMLDFDGTVYTEQSDLEALFANSTHSAVIDTIIVTENQNVEFYPYIVNNGPDAFTGSIEFSLSAAGHNILSTPTITTTSTTISSEYAIYIPATGNTTYKLKVDSMNVWGLVGDFYITLNISAPNTINPANDTKTLLVRRTVTAPTPGVYTPNQGAINVPINTPIQVQFDRNIIFGANLSQVTIMPACGTITTQIQGDKLKIFHSNPLIYETQYTVIIPPNALYLQTTSVSWTFTAEQDTPPIIPAVLVYQPGINAVNVPVNINVAVGFNNIITQGNLVDFNNITIEPSTELGTISKTISGVTLTINHQNDFANNTIYTVMIPANALENVGAITWSFTTEDLVSNPIVSQELIDIYPNPANGLITIKCDENAKVEIYDVMGKLLKTVQTQPNSQIKVSEQAGIYLIKISTNSTTCYKKLLIK